MIWETRIVVYHDVEAETYEEACAIAEEIFQSDDSHHEDFEVDAYPCVFDSILEEAKCFEPGRYAEDIMALNP